jgi:hypothetical protein
MSRRAQLFDISLAFIVLGAMIAIMMVVNIVATETSPWKTLGQRAFELQSTYAQADIAVASLSSAAQWSATEAVRELGANGGHLGKSPCGTSNGFALWSTPDAQTWCIPLASENFNTVMNGKVADASMLVVGTRIPYEFQILNGTLVGIATVPLRLNIMAPAEKFVKYEKTDLFGLWTTTYKHEAHVAGLYVFRPNIEVPFNYNLGVYQNIARALTSIRASCASSDIAEERQECVVAALAGVMPAMVSAEGDTYYVTVTQPEIKFAFSLPQGTV